MALRVVTATARDSGRMSPGRGTLKARNILFKVEAFVPRTFLGGGRRELASFLSWLPLKVVVGFGNNHNEIVNIIKRKLKGRVKSVMSCQNTLKIFKITVIEAQLEYMPLTRRAEMEESGVFNM